MVSVLEQQYDLTVNWEVDSAAGERTALLWNGRKWHHESYPLASGPPVKTFRWDGPSGNAQREWL